MITLSVYRFAPADKYGTLRQKARGNLEIPWVFS
jgi:hypothetical protein